MILGLQVGGDCVRRWLLASDPDAREGEADASYSYSRAELDTLARGHALLREGFCADWSLRFEGVAVLLVVGAVRPTGERFDFELEI